MKIRYKFLSIPEPINNFSTIHSEQKDHFDSSNLESFEDNDLIIQLSSVFRNSINQQYRQLWEAFESNNNKDWEFILHSMTGISGNIGAHAISAKIKELSKLKKDCDSAKTNQSLKELEEVIETSLQDIQTYVSSLK